MESRLCVARNKVKAVMGSSAEALPVHKVCFYAFCISGLIVLAQIE